MSQPRVSNTCREIACGRLVRNAKPYLRTRGSDTQIPVHFDPDVYCSFNCQRRDKSIRHLHRIERLIHMLFLKYADTTNLLPVIAEKVYREQHGDWRQIVVLFEAAYPDTVSLVEDDFLSLRGRLAFLSFNRCTAVLTTFAPLMAYLYQDLDPSIEIHEAHISNVLSDQKVQVFYLGPNGEHEQTAVAPIHSMFRITNTKESDATVAPRPDQLNGTGIYCDTTAAQYGRTAGLQDAKAYHRRHPHSKTEYCASLGNYYHTRHHVQVDWRTAESERSRALALREEAYIRTINNVVQPGIEDIGGVEHLLDMTSKDFEGACTKIVARVQSALLTVATELHEVYLDQPCSADPRSIEDSDRYEEVVDRCLGEGHDACMQALKRRSPGTWEYYSGRFWYQ